MSDDVNLNAYFERIGFSGSIAPTLATLESLHALQPASIPFENLNPVLRQPVALDQRSLQRKLLAERRGGYCFELNLMFLRVLEELGFEAHGHLARVMWGRIDDADLTTDHMLITVDIGGSTYLADVGFGGLLLTSPLRLRTGVEQATAHETYRLTGDDPSLRLEVKRGEDIWAPIYSFALEPVEEAAFMAESQRLNEDPDWFLAQHLLVELCPPSGRRTLFDNRLTIGEGEAREVRTLSGPSDIRATLASEFGIAVPAIDGLDSTLARIVTRSVTTS